MLKSYHTFMYISDEEIIEKKSRFIGHAAYVEDEKAAIEFIASMRKKYSDASHNVFAYRIEAGAVLERQSDDGEPSGTAGLPILDFLRGEQIVNGIIVVTRYFGGTLLGTGGLVRAYGKAAKAAATKAQIVLKKMYTSICIQVDYNLSGKLQYEFLRLDIVINDIKYTEIVEFEIFVENGTETEISNMITDLTSAGAKILMGNTLYGSVIAGEFVLGIV